MIWFVREHAGEVEATLGFRLEQLVRLEQAGAPMSVLARELELDGALFMVVLAGMGSELPGLYGAGVAGHLELEASEVDALKSGQTLRRSLPARDGTRRGSCAIVVRPDDEALVAAFIAEGIVDDRRQVRGIWSDEEKRRFHEQGPLLPQHRVDQVTWMRAPRPWWKFWR